MELKPLSRLQFSHSDGHTSVCFTTDGSQILTCGSDGDVRIWKGMDDADPVSECVGSMAIALSYQGDHFYIGSDNHHVQAYTFPDAKRDGIISRFTAPVTHIAVSADGRFIAAGSCDMEVQVTDTFNSNSITKMSGHTAPVTGVAVDPKSVYVASSSCDGSVRVWDIETGSNVKTIPDVIPTCNDFFRAVILGRPSWQGGSGEFLAIPTEQKVTLYDRGTWLPTIYLSFPKVNGKFTLVEFSPCGKYLCAGSASGELVVWNVLNQKVLAAYIHPKKASFSCIAWHPESASIAVCDRLGQFVVLDDWKEGEQDVEPAVVEEGSNFADDFGEADENDISIDEIKRSAGFGSVKSDDEDDKDADDAVSSVQSFKSYRGPSHQAAFQPSSTPTHFSHRFMVWNAVGMVRGFNTEEEKSIDVEFHDPMFHHTLLVNNYEDFTMAALSKRGLVLASPSSEDSNSKLKCILLNAWDGSKEWTLSMPDGEVIKAVAAADKWVSAATDQNHVRLFTYAGTQRQPMVAPGPVVCLAGHGRMCAVAYHQGVGVAGTQSLGVQLLEVNELYVRTVAAAQPLPISPGSLLQWLGFSDEGRLCSYDSVGVLRGMAQDGQHWVVLSDTRLQPKNPSDQYFVIGLSEFDQKMRCVLCKGSCYPPTTPRPTLVQIPLKLPLCEPDTEKSGHEDTFWRLLMSLPKLEEWTSNLGPDDMCLGDVQDVEKQLSKTLLAMFANASKADWELRASEIAALMSESTLQKAATYATKLGRMHLANKMSNITPKDWQTEARNNVTQFIHYQRTEDYNMLREDDAVGNSQRDLFAQTPQERNIPLEPRLLDEMGTDSPANMMSPARVVNPFKAKSKTESGPRGLAFFDQPPKPKPVTIEPIRNPALLKKVSRHAVKGKSSENKKPPKQTFVSWFASNKERLTQEHPGLEQGELTKKGLELFREFMAQEKLTAESEIAESGETQKRKLDDSEDTVEGAKRVASSKLSAFAFKSKQP